METKIADSTDSTTVVDMLHKPVTLPLLDSRPSALRNLAIVPRLTERLQQHAASIP